MKTFVLAVGLFFSMLPHCLSAESQGKLGGSIFVVTEARDNIKMGLVTIKLFREVDIRAALQKQKPQVEAALTALRSKIVLAATNLAESKRLTHSSEIFERTAKYDKETADTMVKFQKGFIELNRKGGQKTQEEAEELKKQTEKAVSQIRELLYKVQGTNHLASQFKKEAETLNEAVMQTQLEVAQWPSNCASIYFAGLPMPVQYSAKTDADGKFSLKIPKDGRFALAAQATRKTPAQVESYHWLVWVSLDGNDEKSVMLSNDNLLTTDNPESVLKLDAP